MLEGFRSNQEPSDIVTHYIFDILTLTIKHGGVLLVILGRGFWLRLR